MENNHMQNTEEIKSMGVSLGGIEKILDFLGSVQEKCEECHYSFKKLASILFWGVNRCDKKGKETISFFVAQCTIFEREFSIIYRKYCLFEKLFV